MRKTRSISSKIRHQSGVYLLEMMAAIVTSGLLSTALVAAIADSTRLSTSGENQILASTIAQEQIDNVRNTMYSAIDGLSPFPQLGGTAGTGTYALLVNRTSANQTSPNQNVNPRALLIDAVAYDWRTNQECSSSISQDACNATKQFTFQSVTEYVDVNPLTGAQSSPPSNTHQVWVKVKWQEGDSVKSYTVGTLVAQYGIHVY